MHEVLIALVLIALLQLLTVVLIWRGILLAVAREEERQRRR